MSKPYRLQPHFDKKRNRWHLNLPAKISPSGRRERHYFEKHSDALAEANKIRQVFHDYGRSINMPKANRLIESIECWDLLDTASGGPLSASTGSLRRIVIAEVNKRKARERSITLNALFDDYVAKLKKINRSEGYMKQFRWLRGHMNFWLETKVSDLTPGNIKFSLQKLPSGYFNSNLRLLRAVLNHGIKNGWLKTNPALSLDLAHRPRVEVQCLHPTVIEKMFRYAQANDPNLIGSLVLGFFCGLREAEIWRLQWRSVSLIDPHPHVFVPASITKTREPRTVTLSDNAIAWLQCGNRPNPDTRLMDQWTPSTYRRAKQLNYEAAAGRGAKYVQNAKRHCFASYWLALHRNLNELVLLLGHTSPAMAKRHYLGAATYTDAQTHFSIRP